MSNASAATMPAPTVLLDGLAYVQSPRWHEGRLWFAHWGTGEIVAVHRDGNSAFDIAADGSLSNRRVWAAGLGADGICLDAEGAVWVGTADVRLASGRDDAPRGAVARIREGGAVLQRIEHDREIFACMLGGPDRQT